MSYLPTDTTLTNVDSLMGLHVLLTAGPTHEAIDPVRYISNHSTGKMGYALAEELAQRGATVTLISGPTNLVAEHAAISVTRVQSAAQMYEACLRVFASANLTILAAAVADYTPKHVAPGRSRSRRTRSRLSWSKPWTSRPVWVVRNAPIR